MPVGIHVVRVEFINVDSNGNPVRKEEKTTTVGDIMKSRLEHRIIPSESVPTSANSPTVPQYLEAEAANDYVLKYMDQNMIVTYDQSDINSA